MVTSSDVTTVFVVSPIKSSFHLIFSSVDFPTSYIDWDKSFTSRARLSPLVCQIWGRFIQMGEITNDVLYTLLTCFAVNLKIITGYSTPERRTCYCVVGVHSFFCIHTIRYQCTYCHKSKNNKLHGTQNTYSNGGGSSNPPHYADRRTLTYHTCTTLSGTVCQKASSLYYCVRQPSDWPSPWSAIGSPYSEHEPAGFIPNIAEIASVSFNMLLSSSFCCTGHQRESEADQYICVNAICWLHQDDLMTSARGHYEKGHTGNGSL